jgi:hypothetical protein
MEEEMMIITLKSLPHTYKHIIETLNITSTNVDLKFDEFCNKLLQQNKWKKQFDSQIEVESTKQAFAANVKGKGKWARKKGRGNSEDATKSLKNITCHYCGKVSHMKKYSRKRLVDQKTN